MEVVSEKNLGDYLNEAFKDRCKMKRAARKAINLPFLQLDLVCPEFAALQ